ncbi:EAL-associated domain-containing protein [Peribacillus frigoritolerans]|nr:EAL-associated domain-containing protein [Peribacillus frigoritolerans]
MEEWGNDIIKGISWRKPEGEFINKDLLREKFHQECQSFISLETKKLEAVYQKDFAIQQEYAKLLKTA